MTTSSPDTIPSASSTLSFPIEGMTCASCVRRVEKAIAGLPGVAAVAVNLATERADVTFSGAPDAEAVAAAIRRVGYNVARQTIEVGIEGMTCASCVRRVEKAISALPGVFSAAVNLATETATVEVAAEGTGIAGIEAAIRKAGYAPRRLERSSAAQDARQDAKDQELRQLRRDLAISAALTLPIFLIEMGSHFIPAVGHWLHGAVERQWLYVTFFVLASIVQFGPGLRFFKKGVPALLRLAPDMNSLVVLGSTAAWGLFRGGHLPAYGAAGRDRECLFRGLRRHRHADSARPLP